MILWRVGAWYAHAGMHRAAATVDEARTAACRATVVRRGMAILLVLVFSKYVYLASLTSYFTFFLIHKFQISVQAAQLYLFGFLAGVAAGTFAGGPIGDRVGRKVVIWASILGVLPFTLMLPYANLFWTAVLSVVIGLILASAFSAILVYAQELAPRRVGLVSGLFFGFAFGVAGVAAAALGSSRTPRASMSSIACARSCRRSDCSRRFCRTRTASARSRPKQPRHARRLTFSGPAAGHRFSPHPLRDDPDALDARALGGVHNPRDFAVADGPIADDVERLVAAAAENLAKGRLRIGASPPRVC